MQWSLVPEPHTFALFNGHTSLLKGTGMFPAPQRSIVGVRQLALLYNESKNEAGVSKPSVYPTKVYMLAHSKFPLFPEMVTRLANASVFLVGWVLVSLQNFDGKTAGS